MENKSYYKRIADDILDLKLRAFGAINIVGPKWCGKTETAKQRAKSEIMLQKDPNKEGLIYTSKINPMILLEGDKPRLIDEWQDAPTLWNAVKGYCDEKLEKGCFILTSSIFNIAETMHTRSGNLSTMKMYPMSLYESLESNGTVSLLDLFDRKNELEKGCVSDLTIEDLIFAACRGGWPESILLNDSEAQLKLSKDYFNQIFTNDIYSVDKVKRNSQTMEAVIKSYARNISTLAKKVNILEDINATNRITEATLDDYIEVLEKLYIVEDLYGWCPQIRSKSSMRSGRKREFVDPSIAVAALGGCPKLYNMDLKTFGFIFETLCIRDLKIYSQALGGKVSYYHDSQGLEVDCVLHLNDGRYALIDFKLGGTEIDEGATSLNKIEKLIIESGKLRRPDLKIVITGTKYGYKREDGVLVVPIGCLKN